MKIERSVGSCEGGFGTLLREEEGRRSERCLNPLARLTHLVMHPNSQPAAGSESDKREVSFSRADGLRDGAEERMRVALLEGENAQECERRTRG